MRETGHHPASGDQGEPDECLKNSHENERGRGGYAAEAQHVDRAYDEPLGRAQSGKELQHTEGEKDDAEADAEQIDAVRRVCGYARSRLSAPSGGSTRARDNS